MKVLSPTIDLVFKLLLLKSDALLRSMLQAVLGKEITDFSVIDPSIPGELAGDKTIVIDVRVALADGTRVVVEMQIRTHTALRSRLVYYAARDYAAQFRRGQNYDQLTPTVTVVWLVQPLFTELRQLHSVFELRERHSHHLFSHDLTLHLLQLSEIATLSAATTSSEQHLQLWARFLVARCDEERRQLAQEDPLMATAVEALERISEDPEIARQAEERELSLYFYEMSMVSARNEGKLEGKLEGEIHALLTVLHARGLKPNAAQRQSIVLCSDTGKIMSWVQRSVTVASVDELLQG